MLMIEDPEPSLDLNRMAYNAYQILKDRKNNSIDEILFTGQLQHELWLPIEYNQQQLSLCSEDIDMYSGNRKLKEITIENNKEVK